MKEEKARRYGVPVIPPRPTLPESKPNAIAAVCGACGVELYQISGYACSRSDCPVQSRTTL